MSYYFNDGVNLTSYMNVATTPYYSIVNTTTTGYRVNNVDISSAYLGIGSSHNIPVSKIINTNNFNTNSYNLIPDNFELNLINYKLAVKGTHYEIINPSLHNGLLIKIISSTTISFNYRVNCIFYMLGGGGGGGGGGGNDGNAGGGGGAGELIKGSLSGVPANTDIIMTIGSGGASSSSGATSLGNDGGDSKIQIFTDILTAYGGGGGGCGKGTTTAKTGPSTGGSGSFSNAHAYPGTATDRTITDFGNFVNMYSYNNIGGKGQDNNDDAGGGGGGGGTGGAGGWGNGTGGVGGDGSTLTFGNANFLVGGGGGGGGGSGGIGYGGGTNSYGGGTGGGSTAVNGLSATSNTGAGGGGGYNGGGGGGQGGSGVIFLYIVYEDIENYISTSYNRTGWLMSNILIYNGFNTNGTLIYNYKNENSVSRAGADISSNKYITPPYSLQIVNKGGYQTQTITTGTSGLSICVWFYRTSSTGSSANPRIYQLIYNSSTVDEYSVMYSSGSNVLRVSNDTNTNAETTITSAIENNAWNLLVVVVDFVATTTKYYYNGILTLTKTVTGYQKNTLYSWVFGSKTVNQTTTDNFVGYMDEIQIYNQVLTDTQANDLYTYRGSFISSVNELMKAVYILGDYNLSTWVTMPSDFQYAYWIWATPDAQSSAPTYEYISFLYEFYSTTMYTGTLYYAVDDIGDIYFNGSKLGTLSGGWNRDTALSITINVKEGYNLLMIYAHNTGGPAGLIVNVKNNNGVSVLNTDSRWKYYQGFFNFSNYV